MADRDAYRREADDLLRMATATTDLGERSRLISEAVRLHMMATSSEERLPTVDLATDHGASPPGRDEDEEGLEPEAT